MAHAGYWVLLGPTLLNSLLGELSSEAEKDRATV